jgi:hypothetical protein
MVIVRSHIGQISVFPFPFEIELQATTTSMMLIPLEFGELALQEFIQYFTVLISVGYALGPGVNTFKAQQIFLSKLNFCNLFKSPATTSTQKSISSTP